MKKGRNAARWGITERARFRVGGSVRSVAFSTDGRTLASTSTDAEHLLAFWDIASGTPTTRLQRPKAVVSTIALSADWKRAALTLYNDARILVFDVATGEVQRELIGHRQEESVSLAFSADGERLVSVSTGWEGELFFWEMRGANGGLERVRDLEPLGHRLCCSPDGAWVAFDTYDIISAGRDSGAICLLDPHTRKTVWRSPGFIRERASAIAFSADSRLIVGAGGDSRVIVWNRSTGKRICTHKLDEGEGHGSALAVSLDTTTVAVGTAYGNLVLVDASSGKELASILAHPIGASHSFAILTEKIHGLAFSADGNLLASASEDASVAIWKIERRS